MRTVLVLAAIACTASGCTGSLVERAARQATEENHLDFLSDGKLHAFLCGTGVPMGIKGRAGACTAILAGGQFILVDVGQGSWANIADEKLPAGKLSAVLLTHFHSDHITDLGEAATQSWMRGRAAPLDVYGPPGVEQVAAGFDAAYALDRTYRAKLHGARLPSGAGTLRAHALVLPAPEGEALVFEKNGLKVIAFAVDHEPGMPAFGYRFEYGGRALVISGDTRRSQNLIRHATGADVLIHEVVAKRLLNQAADDLAGWGETRLSGMAREVLPGHSSAEDAVEVANAAKVKTLVFTHMGPALSPSTPGFVMRWLFFGGLRTGFDGDVVFGKDEMWIEGGE